MLQAADLTIRLNPADDVVIARVELPAGTTLVKEANNYIGILTSVNCSATVARAIADFFRNKLEKFPNVDGVVALTHKSGCGMASDGEAIDGLRRTMAGYARHPNFFAVQVVGLGCEANQINSLLSTQSLKRHDKLHAYTIQEKGGTTNLVQVLEYAEPVTAKGFVYMDTPGYDPVSATGQVAGGANMICFTTGRGSAYGCRFFELVLETASGKKSKSELLGYGEDEFAPWVLGATM